MLLGGVLMMIVGLYRIIYPKQKNNDSEADEKLM